VTAVDAADRLDPALRDVAARTDLSLDTLATLRESLNQRRSDAARALDTSGVTITDDRIEVEDSRVVPIRIYRGAVPPAPAVVYCHAGAFVLGNLDTDHRQCVEFARRARCTVISVDYRLAPQHPYPAALEDALAVLGWAVSTAADLAIDPGRLAVAGSSAGAALAAGMAQRAAGGFAPPIVFQLLHQPVLDDRPTPSKREFVATPGFDGPAVTTMWHHYLGGEPVPAAAAPARKPELSGVAGAMITCAELDPLRDEAVNYALALINGGVAVELHVFPGTCHGFDSLLPDWETSERLFELQGAALRRALDPAAGHGQSGI
jgi:acetyl esterase